MLRLFGFVFAVVVIPLAFAALAALLAAILPSRLRRVRDCSAAVPANAGILGAITIVATVGATGLWELLTSALGFPICLLPILLIGWTFVLAGIGFGLIAISEIAGRIVLAKLRIYAPPMVSVFAGAFVILTSLVILNLIPCVGWIGDLALLVLGAVGMGAFLLTRTGRRTYPAMVVRRIETL